MKDIILIFLNWLKKSAQGVNNTASSRRLSAFWFVVLTTLNTWNIQLLTSLILGNKENTNEKMFILLDKLITLEYILCGMILILLGLITIQQIINFKNTTLMSIKEENIN